MSALPPESGHPHVNHRNKEDGRASVDVARYRGVPKTRLLIGTFRSFDCHIAQLQC